MKTTSIKLLVGLIALASGSLTICQKSISRVINKSSEYSVAVIPYSDKVTSKIQADPAYIVTMQGNNDTTFEKPLLVDNKLLVAVGAKTKDIVSDDLIDGKNAVIVSKEGTITVHPASNVKTTTEAFSVDPELFIPEKKEDPVYGIRNTSITKIRNKSGEKMIHILPFEYGVISPRGTKGYTLTASEDGWGTSVTLDTPIFIGSELNNGGLIVIVEGQEGVALNPPGLKDQSSTNTLVITDKGIKLEPAS